MPEIPIIRLAIYAFIAAEILVFGLLGLMIWWGWREFRDDKK